MEWEKYEGLHHWTISLLWSSYFSVGFVSFKQMTTHPQGRTSVLVPLPLVICGLLLFHRGPRRLEFRMQCTHLTASEERGVNRFLCIPYFPYQQPLVQLGYHTPAILVLQEALFNLKGYFWTYNDYFVTYVFWFKAYETFILAKTASWLFPDTSTSITWIPSAP